MLGPAVCALSALLVPLPSVPGVAHLHVSGAVAQTAPRDPVVVGTKNFGESYLLGEMFAQLLEARGYDVVRRPGLGASELVFQALRTRSIDVYPEYTGTGLLAILGRAPPEDATAAYREVADAFRAEWDLRWLPPLGFQNTFAITVRAETADSLGLETISDLAAVAPQLVAGFTPDFIGRADGLLGLRETYGLDPGRTRSLMQAVKYRAIAEGEVDFIDGYSTDGFIARYDLTVLRDDMGFFPPYDAAPVVTGELERERPDVVAVLTELSGRFDEGLMRTLNQRVEVDGEPLESVAADALRIIGLVERGEAGGMEGRGSRAGRPSSEGSLLAYLWNRRAETFRLTGRHLWLVLLSLSAGIAVAVPLGLGLERARRSAETTIRAMGLLQTIPSIALLAFMIPFLGIGVAPAVVALFLYSLFPIVRNTYTGVRDADAAAVEAARALGMTDTQLLAHVRLPLAAPVIMAGVRTAAVITVGTATLAAFIGAGGLGDPIVAGLALSDTRLVLSGAIPAAVLALLVDAALALVERGVAPKGLGDPAS